MRENRAKRIGTKVRIVTQEIDELRGMRPFQEKRFGAITGHNFADGKLVSYKVSTDLADYTLTRVQFATSALTKSFRYKPKKD